MLGTPVRSEGITRRVLTDEEKQASSDRADFMKRFFAVAVSVGFASKITTFEFIPKLDFPTNSQIHEIILLLLAMVVIIGSWEFYFSSISKRPLIDRSRFYADIVIVSLYIILLLSVKNLDAFLFYFSIVMLFYLFWDILSMRAYPDHYGIKRFTLGQMIYVFWNGLSWRPGHPVSVKATPIITLWWLIVFISIFVYHVDYSPNFYIDVAISSVVYVLYRADQRIQLGLLVRSLLLAAIVCFYVVMRTFA